MGVGENEAGVIGLNARASSGRFAPTLSTEQFAAIAAGLIPTESQRSIAARLDLPRTTVRDARKQAPMTDIVTAIRVAQAAEREAAADALKSAELGTPETADVVALGSGGLSAPTPISAGCRTSRIPRQARPARIGRA